MGAFCRVMGGWAYHLSQRGRGVAVPGKRVTWTELPLPFSPPLLLETLKERWPETMGTSVYK